MVIRVTYGGYLQGGAIYHSQCGEVLFTHIPGLRVVIPSNAQDANGLLRTAIRCDDPVLFLEHKHLYRQTYNKGLYPGPDYMIPFGKAARVREGTRRHRRDLRRARAALAGGRAPGGGRRASTPRSSTCARSSPYDWDAIAASVRKTGRVLVAHEDSRSWGYGAEIAARIADELFEHLDAPVRRVGALDTFVGYNPVLEDAILPQVSTLADGDPRAAGGTERSDSPAAPRGERPRPAAAPDERLDLGLAWRARRQRLGHRRAPPARATARRAALTRGIADGAMESSRTPRPTRSSGVQGLGGHLAADRQRQTVGLGRAHDVVDGAQHGRVQRLVEARTPAGRRGPRPAGTG